MGAEETTKSDIDYIGVDDKTLDLFEGQYSVPNGVSYNSYVITDDKTAVIDTVDTRATDEWFAKLAAVLKGKNPDYLVILHMEPDHGANIKNFAERYPNASIVSNAKVFGMIAQFFPDFDIEGRKIVVSEQEPFSLGRHVLRFVMAPMVHWPEVMVAFDEYEKVLFSADAFGKFGTLDIEEDWIAEARRYYFNIVGRYGVQVQSLLKKAKTMDVKKIYPLHGPTLDGDIDYYFNRYDLWSRYEPEDKGVFIACASVYGHTKEAAVKLQTALKEKGVTAVLCDLARDDISSAVENAFRYDKLVLASVTLDGEIFPAMKDFISHLKNKLFQKRTVAFIENGSWMPVAAKKMKAELETLKNLTFIDKTVTLKSALTRENIREIDELASLLATD